VAVLVCGCVRQGTIARTSLLTQLLPNEHVYDAGRMEARPSCCLMSVKLFILKYPYISTIRLLPTKDTLIHLHEFPLLECVVETYLASHIQAHIRMLEVRIQYILCVS
jgi:hypothetical protein